MIGTNEAQALLNGGSVIDTDGNKVGRAGQVYLDDQSGDPAWVTTKTGLFGNAETFVPLAEATVEGNDVRVPYTKDKIKDAPRIDDEDGHLSREEEANLYRYYGLDYSHDATDTSVTEGRDDRAGYAHTSGHDGDVEGDVGHDVSGPNTDDAMTRSEERLDVHKQTESAGKARLRKYIVTENVTQTVPVSREEVRVEREPITDANRDDAMAGGDLTDEEHEIDLKAERVVVNKEAVPVERVRLDTETVTEDQQVSEDVRKEQIDADTDVDRHR